MAKPEIEAKVAETARVPDLTALLDRKPPSSPAASGSGSPWAARSSATQGLSDGRAAEQSRRQAAGADARRDRLVQNRLGTTTVYVTHDQTEAMTLGDRVVVLRAGEAQQIGTPDELYNHPANLFRRRLHRIPGDELLPGGADPDRSASAVR